MSNNIHNTIGPKIAFRHDSPYAHWHVLDQSGEKVGLIEAEYQDGNANSATRARRWVIVGYTVTWFDGDCEGYFSTDAHGTARKAFAVAKAYAEGTTEAVRKRWPVQA